MRLRNRVGLVVRVWTGATLALLVLAGPANAEHDPDGDGQYCVDSSTAHDDDQLTSDTYPAGYCVASGGVADFDGRVERGAGGAGGAVGAVPTRIDAGAGGAAIGGNPAALGAVLLGATSAGAAVVARRRRRG